ncbi:MAG: phosphoribosyl-ATP diphosphatase [Chromatiales bacterium]|jgi:phosphoribosyl-ATP pyrophosphohydrolase|nr:phosphoribosyl-ATP diphosphatase [Chromatiales bacterium]MDP6149922.1 phosphoribosyl-ATP diphosphatase [Gammaproteobacteria bacterium]MDP7093754.1 phosphoribosyl-ATP diphosphatase [Gammaproteobacteria bacterium]MDP7269774.1 phosphoribosyl-ATP diphosphatase [Gammaproteobacteria bacterium]HJP04647.1 phosphoribosyl-ATP diphosphatase [Gammaproteobacteria bacterium]
MNNSSSDISFIAELEEIIRSRRNADSDESYTKTLFDRGTPFIAQKVGEEAVELVIAALQGDKKRTTSEAADLIYHLLVLLEANELSIGDIAAELSERHTQS